MLLVFSGILRFNEGNSGTQNGCESPKQREAKKEEGEETEMYNIIVILDVAF